MSLSEISKITTQLLLKEPFYGHFLLGVPKELDQRTPTASVSLMQKSIIKLKVNPDFWSSLSNDHKYGLIKHEVLHLVMKHLFLQKNYSNKILFNIACDLVVNQYIKPLQLPEGAIILDTFSDLRTKYGIVLEPFQSTDYYYKALQPVIQNPGKFPDSGTLGDLMADKENEQLAKHKNWYVFEEIDKASEKIMEYQLYNQIKTVVDKFKSRPGGYGLLPANLIEYLNSFLASYKPQVDWKRELKKFAASSNSSFIKNTLRRPSKRYGTTPGIKIKRRNRLLVALDTSGSVPSDDITKFFGELHQIWRHGAEVIITECDAAIQKTYPYKGEIPGKIHGRGGTSFTPPIILANQEINPDGIVYFTDGFASPPNVKSRAPILWIITTNGIKEAGSNTIWSELPGKKIKMRHE